MPRKQNHEHPTEKVSAQPHFDQTAPEIQSYGTVSHSDSRSMFVNFHRHCKQHFGSVV